MTNSERASYIRGLMDGLELDPSAKETKVLNAIVELLDDLCLSVEELDEGLDELAEQWMRSTTTWASWKRTTTSWTRMTSAAAAAAITIITMTSTTLSSR